MLKIIIIDQEETKVFQSESFEEIEKALDYFYSDVEEEVAQPEFSIDGLLELRSLINRENEFELEDVVIVPSGRVGVVVKEYGDKTVEVFISKTETYRFHFSALKHFDFEEQCK